MSFDNCSNWYTDNEDKSVAGMIFDRHGYDVEKNCDTDFVNYVVGMFDGVDGFDDLEIEILD